MAALDTLDANEAAPIRTVAGKQPKASRRKLLIIGAVSLLALGALGLATKLTVDMAARSAAATGAVDLPEIVANLNAGPRRSAFVRLKAQLVLANNADEVAVMAAEPRIQDLFQTYLRDMRPDELRGSAGSYRLREELLTRANIAVAPARVTEILFIELLVQ